MILSLSSYYFIISAIQFWISDYMIEVLKFDGKNVFTAFTIVCTSGPVMGAVASGYFGMKIGGYNSVYALPSCILFSAVMLVFGLPLSNVDDFYMLNTLLWVIMFLGGLMIPLMTGIMLQSLDPELRPNANAFASFTYNLLGFLPAPFIYGYICSVTGGKTSKWGMSITMNMNIIALIFLIFAFAQ